MDFGILNPTTWPSEPFIVLIVAALALRFVLSGSTRRWQRVLSEALAIGAAALLYFLVRGFVDAKYEHASANAHKVIDLEKSLGIFHEPDLQDAILNSDLAVNLVNWMYIWGHWPVIAATVFWLVVARPHIYPRYRNALLLSGALGMLIFATFPVTPPRLLDGLAFVDTVSARSSSYRILQPPGLTNPYAAMPSLHFGWNLLMGIAIFRHARSTWGRSLGIIMPVAMFMAIVLTANHYILDGVAGGLLVTASLGLVSMTWKNPLRKTAAPSAPAAKNASAPLLLPTRRPLTIAHRYGNQLDSLERAEAAGADIVEADIWLYRGQLEVRHTKTLGPVPVLWDRWSLERGNKPRLLLRELLENTAPGTLLMLDIKGRNPEIARRVIEELQRYHPGQPVLVCSQNWDLLEPFRDYPPATIVHSIGNRWQLRRAWPHLKLDSHDAISIQYRLLDRKVVAALQEHVSLVFTWPINSPGRLEQVTRWGVDGVIVDNLDLMDAHAEEKATREPVLHVD